MAFDPIHPGVGARRRSAGKNYLHDFPLVLSFARRHRAPSLVRLRSRVLQPTPQTSSFSQAESSPRDANIRIPHLPDKTGLYARSACRL